ncbi:type VI secretion system protein TssA [Rhodoferax lacus]|uniref:Type VI secretion system protein TssA n=1 Tax=Rhodoferax lacus TaxID=2184758 RepID=A0A3E1RA55_9BURK|nr:type VI secretion system ImpA family N-terminal domain-containing protein [Rhodoferax lacus]RFO96246.1 type VI secretion system protein TssA [Rhodoferax lacus]
MNPLKHLFSALKGGAAPERADLGAALVAPGLLAPVSALLPCGESLEYDNAYAVLQSRLEPKAEVQYGNFSSKPEGPDWAEVERDARRLLLKSKDISMLVWFTRARCRLGGASGLLEGLATLQAVLQTYPEQVHPQLVLEGVPDPAVRANALAALCDPEGLLGDVREVVVSGSTAFRLSVRDVERALAVPRAPYAPDPDVVKRQLADLHAKGDAALAALLACGDSVQAIAQWSRASLLDEAPSFVPLLRLLATLASFSEVEMRGTKMQADAVETMDTVDRVGALESKRAQPVHLLPSASHATAPALTLSAQHNPAVLEEREQIRALLRQVRQWIEHHEPSSPVTILIKQADRMWGKRFSEIATMIPPDLMRAWDSDD